MLYALKIYFRDLWIWLPLGLGVVLNGLVWWYVLSYIHPTEAQIFLHYNIIFGVDLAGSWQKMYVLPGVGTLIVLCNYMVAFFFYRHDKTLARILSVLTLPVGIFLAYSIFLIVGLNI